MKTILVVEPNPAIRETVTELLIDQGFSAVVGMHDGREALLWLEENREVPGLLLADAVLPVMDTSTFVGALQNHSKPELRALPVVVLSPAGLARAPLACVDWLERPIDVNRLFGLCAKFVNAEPRLPPLMEPVAELEARYL
jgi:CheY-like chemotaxis protein